MNGIKTPVTLQGVYNCKKIDKHGNVLEETGPFSNIFTDYGFQQIKEHSGDGSSDSSPFYELNWCIIGSGVAAVDPSDTGLSNKLYSTTGRNSRSLNWSSDPIYHEMYYEHNFVVGTFSDDTISEVGRGFNGTNTVTRALLPSPVTVGYSQGLLVESRLRIGPSTLLATESDSVTGSFLFNGSPITYTMKVIANEDAWDTMWNWDENAVNGGSLTPYFKVDTGSGNPGTGIVTSSSRWANSHSRDTTYSSGIREIVECTWNPGNATGENTRILIGFRPVANSTWKYYAYYIDLDSPINVPSDLELLKINFLWEINNV